MLALLSPLALRGATAVPSAFPFGSNDSIHDLKVSPDGNSVAFLLSDGGPSSLAVHHLDTGKTEVLFQASPLQFDYAWKGNNRIIAFQNRGTRRVILSVVPGAKGLTAFPGYGTERKANGVVDWLPADPNHIMVGTDHGWGVMDVTTGDIATISSTEMTVGGVDYVTDGAGSLRLRFQQNRDGIDLEHKQSAKELFTPVYHWSWEDPSVANLGFARDPNVAYFLTQTESNWGEIRPFDLTQKKFGEAIVKGSGAELESAIFAPDRSRIIGVKTELATGRKDFWLDPAARLLQATLDASLPKRRNLIASMSNDLQVAAFISIKDSEPGEFMVIDHRKGSLARIGLRRAQQNYATFVPAQALEITARDGLKIHGVLLQPAGAPGPHALVVIPLSSPFGFKSNTFFDWQAQYLVSLGYSVLRIDYRGAQGFGRSYSEAGRHQFARKIPDDIEDFTRWSLQNNITAPGRIAIFGRDDGATQALIAATQTPDLYACVINWDGEVDLSRIEYTAIDSWPARKAIEYFYSDDASALEARSALKFMGRLNGPVFNLYPSHREFPDLLGISGDGTMVYNDNDVNERRSRAERALSSAHKRYVSATPPKASDVPSSRDAMIYYYTQIGGFLLNNLPPSPPPS